MNCAFKMPAIPWKNDAKLYTLYKEYEFLLVGGKWK
jgi:hypothetical protein